LIAAADSSGLAGAGSPSSASALLRQIEHMIEMKEMLFIDERLQARPRLAPHLCSYRSHVASKNFHEPGSGDN